MAKETAAADAAPRKKRAYRRRKTGAKATGLIGKAVAKQVKAALKQEKAKTKLLVKSLVAKELKRSLKALLK